MSESTPPPHRPRRDPLLRAVGGKQPKAIEEVTKDDASGVTGSPAAGRTTIEDAKKKSPAGFLQILGPGLITGASDDDPSGIGTYSQVGSQFGYGLLWTALFTFPLMAAVQELCARIALQTGVGLGVALRRKFPSWLVALSVLALLIANTINVGADLGAVAAGGELLSGGLLKQAWLVIPAGLLILGLQFFVSCALIFKIFKWLTLALFAYVVTAFIRPSVPEPGRLFDLRPSPRLQQGLHHGGGRGSRDDHLALPLLLAGVMEVDEMRAAGLVTESQRRGVRQQELRAARTDILIGMFFSNLVMYCIIMVSAAVLHAHGKTHIQSAQDAASALAPIAGPFAFVLFALGIIGTGLLAIPILSGSAAYALKEFLDLPGTLASKPRYRPTFYAVIGLAVLVGMAINFMRIDPIQALFYAAVINGLVAPPLLALIVLLGSDRRYMKDKVSGRLSRSLTWLATALMVIAAAALGATTFLIR